MVFFYIFQNGLYLLSIIASTPHTMRKIPIIHRTSSGHIKTKSPATTARIPMATQLTDMLFVFIQTFFNLVICR
jgi:hypothetical protein